MKVGEHDLTLAHTWPLGLDRLLDLHHHLGPGPYVGRPRYERRTDRAIRLVREPRPDPRPVLHQNGVPVGHQRLDTRGHEGDPILSRLDLFGHTNDHGRSGVTPLLDVSVLRLCATSSLDVFILSRATPQFDAPDQRIHPRRPRPLSP